MKNTVRIAMGLIVISFVFSGCAMQNDKVDDLMKRIEELESRLADEFKESDSPIDLSETEEYSGEIILEGTEEEDTSEDSEKPEVTQETTVLRSDETPKPTSFPHEENEQSSVEPETSVQTQDALESLQESSSVPIQAETPAVNTDGQKYSCLLEGKTTEEIVMICNTILSYFPYTGQTYSDYKGGIPVKPIRSSESGMICEYTADQTYLSGRETVILSSVSGTQTAMDGTILCNDGFQGLPESRVSIYICGYARAVEVYEKLFGLLAPLFEEVKENRGVSNWDVSGCYYTFYNESKFQNGTVFLQMSREANGYYYIEARKVKLP